MRKSKKRKSWRLIKVKGKLKFVRRKKNKKFSRMADYSKVNWEKVDKILGHDREILLTKLQREKANTTKTKEILRILATGAVIGMSFLIPTLPMAIAPFIIDRKKYRITRFGQTIGDLRRQKLIEIVNEKKYTVVRITREGKLRALRYKINEMKILPQKKWDGLWRLIIFDIPEKEKSMREIFRNHLKLLKFYNLQKSVWVHAYPCFDEIEFLREIYHIRFDVSYIVAKQIEGDTLLRSHFELD